MPKLKTRKAAAKRIKITGTGKYMRRQTHRSHLLTDKRSKRKRELSNDLVISKTDVQNVKRMAPFLKP